MRRALIRMASRQVNWCSTKKGHSVLEVLREKEKARYSTVLVGQRQMALAETRGALSFVQGEKGTGQQSSELLLLSYTCGKCSGRQTRSFSKCAHDQGTVLVRCADCDNVHLVADNLGWFDQQGSSDKIYDPVAIVKFLKQQFQRNAAEEKNKQ